MYNTVLDWYAKENSACDASDSGMPLIFDKAELTATALLLMLKTSPFETELDMYSWGKNAQPASCGQAAGGAEGTGEGRERRGED